MNMMKRLQCGMGFAAILLDVSFQLRGKAVLLYGNLSIQFHVQFTNKDTRLPVGFFFGFLKLPQNVRDP